MACCFISWRHLFLSLFTLLFIIDSVSDILAIFVWYRSDYFIWFLIGFIIILISFLMQWLYCLNSMSLYLKYLQSFKYSGWNNYNHYLNYNQTHYPQLSPKNENNDYHHQIIQRPQQKNKQKNLKKISKCKEMTFMIIKFVIKSILLDLILQFGIISAFINNLQILNKYNNNSINKNSKNNKKKKRNRNNKINNKNNKSNKYIFNFDPKNNYNSISSLNTNNNKSSILQFNTNYITSNFADLCILHCYFQSVSFSLLHTTFFLSQLLSFSFIHVHTKQNKIMYNNKQKKTNTMKKTAYSE